MFKLDGSGRLVTLPHDFRHGNFTAFATLSANTAAQLFPGDADYFTDIQEISFANSSSAAAGTAPVGIDLVNDGSIIRHIDLPFAGTVQLMFDMPLKQYTKNTPWNVQFSSADISGTTVKVGATLIKKN